MFLKKAALPDTDIYGRSVRLVCNVENEEQLRLQGTEGKTTPSYGE